MARTNTPFAVAHLHSEEWCAGHDYALAYRKFIALNEGQTRAIIKT